MLNTRFAAGLLALTLTASLSARPALAASAAEINREANAALAKSPRRLTCLIIRQVRDGTRSPGGASTSDLKTSHCS